MLVRISSGHGRVALAASAGTALALLALLALGPAGTLVLLGGALLSTGVARAVPGLAGPAGWAAGLLVQLGLLAGGSLALSTVSPRLHGVVPHLALLLGPVLVGAALLVLGHRRGSPRAGRVPQRGGLAAVVAAVALLVTAWVAAKGSAYDAVWAMSGDARNHVINLRSMLWNGGLTLDNLRSSPAVFDAVAATLSGADGRGGLAAGDLMLHDGRAMATTYVVCIIAVGLLLVSALLEATPQLLVRRRLGLPVAVALVVAAGSAASPLVLGTGLLDGFLTAYGALVPALAAIVLALRCCSRPAPSAFALLGPATLLTLFCWTILAAVPVAATLAAAFVLALRWQAASRQPRITTAWVVAWVLALGSLLAVVGIAVTQWEALRAAFELTGAITSPEPRVLPLLGLVALALLLMAGRWVDRGLMLVPLAVAVSGVLVVQALRLLPPGPLIWTYYSVKSGWLVSACLVWLAFLPVVRLAANRPADPGRWQQASRVAGAGVLSFAVLIALGFSTTVAEPIAKASSGWGAPTADAIERTAEAGNRGGPFVLWGWSDPGNDRLANFWAGTTWGTDPAGTIVDPNPIGWAYAATGQASDLCLLAHVPSLRVITRTTDLADQLRAACPTVRVRIVTDRTGG